MKACRTRSTRLRRSITLVVAAATLAAFPRVLAADDCCGCLETCRQTFGGLRYGTLMLLHDCWVTNGDTCCVYQAW